LHTIRVMLVTIAILDRFLCVCHADKKFFNR
jgi:hypothetical protein